MSVFEKTMLILLFALGPVRAGGSSSVNLSAQLACIESHQYDPMEAAPAIISPGDLKRKIISWSSAAAIRNRFFDGNKPRKQELPDPSVEQRAADEKAWLYEAGYEDAIKKPYGIVSLRKGEARQFFNTQMIVNCVPRENLMRQLRYMPNGPCTVTEDQARELSTALRRWKKTLGKTDDGPCGDRLNNFKGEPETAKPAAAQPLPPQSQHQK